MALTYGTVVGRFVEFSDLESPLSGKVIFTPTVSQMQFPSETPPVTALQQARVCPVIDGNLYDSTISNPTTDTPLGVSLLASDQPNALPSTVQYKVVFKLDNVTVQPSDVYIDVPANSTVDLANVIPAIDYTHLPVVVSQEERILAQQAAQEAKEAQLAAATSESNAALSESAAATSESNTATAASNAATSESNAAISAGEAESSASAAAGSANAASSSATAATGSANAAALSATAASGSATAASTSAAQFNTWFLRGNGSPVGVITPADAGVQYVDLAATNGARVWISTGTTSSAWRVADGDTGTRSIRAYLNATYWNLEVVHNSTVRRIANQIFWQISIKPNQTYPSGTNLALTTGLTWPRGFNNISDLPAFDMPLQIEGPDTARVWLFNRTEGTRVARPEIYVSGGAAIGTYSFVRGTGVHFTNDPWPTTLPGTPA